MTGCTPVSEACDHCYAEGMARRFGKVACPGCPHDGTCTLSYAEGCGAWIGDGPFTPTFHPDRLDKPLHWRKPRRIFVCSMSDLFHEAFTDEQIDRVWDVMTTENHTKAGSWNGTRWTWYPHHTFMVLTKRPERMRDYMLRRQQRAQEYADKFKDCPTEAMRNSPAAVAARQQATEPSAGIWLGVTAENQARADQRIPILLDTPAAVRFVSVEPMLGPVKFAKVPGFNRCGSAGQEMLRNFWVIVGGENGPGARPMQPEWALDVYRQCKAAGVPFWWKQAGAWLQKQPPVPGMTYCEMEGTREFPKAAS